MNSVVGCWPSSTRVRNCARCCGKACSWKRRRRSSSSSSGMGTSPATAPAASRPQRCARPPPRTGRPAVAGTGGARSPRSAGAGPGRRPGAHCCERRAERPARARSTSTTCRPKRLCTRRGSTPISWAWPKTSRANSGAQSAAAQPAQFAALRTAGAVGPAWRAACATVHRAGVVGGTRRLDQQASARWRSGGHVHAGRDGKQHVAQAVRARRGRSARGWPRSGGGRRPRPGSGTCSSIAGLSQPLLDGLAVRASLMTPSSPAAVIGAQQASRPGAAARCRRAGAGARAGLSGCSAAACC